MLKQLWNKDDGVLTFEWIVLLTLLVIGVIGGVAGIRDAILHEAEGTVSGMVSLDQEYEVVPPLAVGIFSLSGSDSQTCTSSAGYSAWDGESTFYMTNRLSTAQLDPIIQENGAAAGTCALP